MRVTSTDLDLLAEELGACAGRVERELALRFDAAIAELRRQDAERALQLAALERSIADRITVLERAAAERIAAVKDGAPGRDVDPELLRQLVCDAVARAMSAIPAPQSGKDGRDGIDGKDGTSISIDDVATIIAAQVAAEVARAIAAIPTPRDGRDGKDGKDGKDGRDGKDGDPGRDGTDGRDGKDGDPGKDGRDGIDGVSGKDGRDGIDGDNGKDGNNGIDGKDGRSPRVRSTYSADVGDYSELDIVVLNGNAFIARQDNPGPCPGDGWQVIATQGKTGRPGERGMPGPQGPPGPPGRDGPSVKALTIDTEGKQRLVNADGSVVECDFYEVLASLK